MSSSACNGVSRGGRPRRVGFAAGSLLLFVLGDGVYLSNSADAGGLARPNPVSARSVGMGGAYSAIADDPTALHFNPAGLALTTGSNIMIGAELVVAPRTYEPKFADDTCSADPAPPACQTQEPTAPLRPLPSLGFSTRLVNEGVPSRLAFGVGVWNTFGGQLEYPDDDPEIPGTLAETRNAIIEVVPGIGYQVNDVLSVGVAFRLGIGLFDSVAVQRPTDADMSSKGIGAGGTVGLLVTPSDALRIGVYYRTGLTVTTSGTASLFTGTNGRDDPPLVTDLEFKQEWPQAAGLSVAVAPTSKLTVAAQFDWYGWSRVNSLRPVFAGQESLTRQAEIRTDWNDNIQLHIGIELEATSSVDVRAGFTYDSRAVPERLMERQFLDTDGLFFALGGSYHLSKSWRLDSAFEIGPGGSVTVKDNRAQVSAWASRANVSPGEHSGSLYTFELAAQYLY